MKETLTSRERVLKALNFETPDRIPIDLGGNQTGIHKIAYEGLIKRLGIRDNIQIMDAVQQLAQPCEEVLKRFHIDFRYIRAGAAASWKGGIEKNQRDGRVWFDLKDEFGIVWSMPESEPYFMDISFHPLAKATIKDIAEYPFPKGNDESRFEGLRERARELKNYTSYAIVSGISGVVYEICWYLRGLEQWFIDLHTNQEFCEKLIDQTLKFWMDWFSIFLKEVGDLVDVIMIGDDLAGQSGPLFRPEIYKSIVKPRQKKLVQYIKSKTNAKIWYHTCGNCIEYIPELVDNGVNVLNPVQISAEKMDPDFLKAKFGSKIVFWGGGCDSQHVLPFATQKEVEENVRLNINSFKKGGGYVFNNVHNIQAGVPADNIIALFDSAYKYGFYE